jgi:putative protease
LLAPAGNIESFFAALDSGADAIYVGCGRHNARALAANFSLEEIGRLIEYAHGRKVRLYVALNALAREEELQEMVGILADLEQMQPDGLIIQDAGIARLCNHYFPGLELHASTLMTVHNSEGVHLMETMGFQRAVLARELTIDEIAQIAALTRLELEVFVHGAICFSYSGQCLASSFFGGRSSLRGRCTQPCRRLYRSGRDQGYFFSTNDLSAIDLVPRLRDMRLAALKIEGRMKPASYVAAVVRAYRLVLDAPGDQAAAAVAEARHRLRQALGRKPTQGFFSPERSREIISPHRSGASGRLAATIEWTRGNRMALRLRQPLVEGDRLRLDSDDSSAKSAFTLRRLSIKGRQMPEAQSGSVVTVPRIVGARRGDRLFKTHSSGEVRSSAAKLRRLLREKTATPAALGTTPVRAKSILSKPRTKRDKKQPTTIYLRLAHRHHLGAAFQAEVRWVVLEASRSNLNSLSRLKISPARRDRLYWALPTIIPEKDLSFYRAQVSRLQNIGYNRWLVSNWGHFRFFDRQPETLVADSTFNLLNSQACSLLHELGCERVILSLENDRLNLGSLLQAAGDFIPLVTVYGRPPLFTSRLEVRPRQGTTIRSPGNDCLQQERRQGLTLVRSEVPLCLFEHLQNIRNLGVRGLVVDLRGERLQPGRVRTIMEWLNRLQCPRPHSTLNYKGTLV